MSAIRLTAAQAVVRHLAAQRTLIEGDGAPLLAACPEPSRSTRATFCGRSPICSTPARRAGRSARTLAPPSPRW
jgi:hypothetical protein